jgi:hypothetical protein
MALAATTPAAKAAINPRILFPPILLGATLPSPARAA